MFGLLLLCFILLNKPKEGSKLCFGKWGTIFMIDRKWLLNCKGLSLCVPVQQSHWQVYLEEKYNFLSINIQNTFVKVSVPHWNRQYKIEKIVFQNDGCWQLYDIDTWHFIFSTETMKQFSLDTWLILNNSSIMLWSNKLSRNIFRRKSFVVSDCM